MSDTKTLTTREQRRELLAQQARKIDEAAAGAMELFHGSEVSTERELALACAMVDLRAALTPEVMEPIMSLMNSPLGFLTDKDPSKPVMKDGKWEAPKPYSVEVVRDCVIAAKMLGFRVVGNEMNIISGKFYPAKAGFRRKLTDGKSFPGLTDFRDTYEVPRIVGERGALVKCRASWKRNGVPDSMEVEFAIKNNAGMGSDAILGKAERKLCKRVHDVLLGASTPDADIEDLPAANATVTPAGAPRPSFGAKPEAAPSDDQIPGAEVPPAATGAAPIAAAEATTDDTGAAVDAAIPAGGPVMTAAQERLSLFLVSSGIIFDDFTDWMRTTGRAGRINPKDWADCHDVPDAIIEELESQPKALERLKMIHGTSRK